MSSEDIFRCNRCWTQLCLFENDSSTEHPQRNYITTCQHLLCGRCQTTDQTKCAHCGNKAKFCPITKNMSLNLRILFQPIEQVHKIVTQIDKFQRAQKQLIQQRLFESINQLTQNIAKIDQLEQEEIQKNRNLRSQYQKLRAIIKEAEDTRYV